MKTKIALLATLLLSYLVGSAAGQQIICENGRCRIVPAAPVFQRPVLNPVIQPNTIVLVPVNEQIFVAESDQEIEAFSNDEDRFDQVIRATVRVTLSGVCGSGTVVGRDGEGNALVLTNAHVAGSTRGRMVNLERWNTDGSSERGTGAIIASGYGRGMGVDFALLKCNSNFAQDVTPIPLADRYPNRTACISTYGCPRCEWPSMQVLKLNRAEGQILSWKPEAIGGRSGSSLIEYTDDGPRVVGLLTWAGGGEGLGQSTPFLLNAMRGRLPTSLESLPPGTREVECQESPSLAVFQVPATTSGQPLNWPVEMVSETEVQDDLIDSIVEKPKPNETPNENGLLNRNRNREGVQGLVQRGLSWLKRTTIVALLCAVCGVIGYFVGKRWSK